MFIVPFLERALIVLNKNEFYRSYSNPYAFTSRRLWYDRRARYTRAKIRRSSLQYIVNSSIGIRISKRYIRLAQIREHSKKIYLFSFFLHIIPFHFIDLIKDSARPSYWVPDSDREAHFCCVCTKLFGTAEELASNGKKSGSMTTSSQSGSGLSIDISDAATNLCDRKRHHCRACGQAVCDNCSQNRRPVPERGWLTDVRVCDTCNKKSPFQ